MNKKELQVQLELLQIKKERYSLTGELKENAIILYQNYHVWEVFYLDEKGNRERLKKFDSEDAVCMYIYEEILKSKKLESDHGINI